MSFYNRVYCSTATTGTGSVTPGSAVAANYLSFANANGGSPIPNPTTFSYELEEGPNFEIGIGVWNGALFTRTVTLSCIAGTISTSTKMNLGSYGGGQTARVVQRAEDIVDVNANTSVFGTWSVTNITNSSNPTSGALTTSGGLGVALDTNLGGYLGVGGSLNVGATGAPAFGKARVHAATDQNFFVSSAFSVTGYGTIGFINDVNSSIGGLEIRASAVYIAGVLDSANTTSGTTTSSAGIIGKSLGLTENLVMGGDLTQTAGTFYNNSNLQTYPTSSFGFALANNFSGGSAEVDFFNVDNGAPESFRFYQKTGASAATLLLSLSTAAAVFSENVGAGGAITGTQAGFQATATGQPMLVMRSTGGAATKQMARFVYDAASALTNPGFLFQTLSDAGAFSTNDNVFWNGGGASFGSITYPPAAGGILVQGQSVFAAFVQFNNNVAATGSILSTGTAGIGYKTGAGGTVTQATNKATGVTLNKTSGQITMNNAALASNTTASFVMTNSTIAATDTVSVELVSGNANAGTYQVWSEHSASGSVIICARNITAGSLSEALVLQFNVIKGVTT